MILAAVSWQRNYFMFRAEIMSVFGGRVAKVQLFIIVWRESEDKGPHLSRGPQYSPFPLLKEK